MHDYTAWVEAIWADAPREFALLWLALALWVVLVVIRPSSTLLLRDSEAGRLEISRYALHRMIEACCEQLNGVANARAKVCRCGGKFHTRIRLKVRPDAKLDAIQGYLSQEIEDIYRRHLGITEVGRIRIKVTGVLPEPKGF